MAVLVVNAGSTSIKVGLFDAASPAVASSSFKLIWSGQVAADGEKAVMTATDSGGARQTHVLKDGSFESAIEALLDAAVSNSERKVEIVGHRVVHGGARYSSSVVVDERVMTDLYSLVGLAPEHELSNIKGIVMAARLFAGITQVAVFDTAFHQSMPEHRRVYALPYEWYRDLGVKRYGFHGISHGYCASRVAEVLNKPLVDLRLITCHLGGGASLAAISDGVCQMTTMGYTPLEGMMMGKRCGSIDPGIVLQLLIDEKYTAEELLHILNEESGLKGLSGVSDDLRAVQAAADRNNERAKLALEVYAYSLRMHIGALTGVLGGLDAIAFTGGVGENSGWIRAVACKSFQFLGLKLDSARNSSCSGDEVISAEDSKVSAVVVKAREELAIARECARFL